MGLDLHGWFVGRRRGRSVNVRKVGTSINTGTVFDSLQLAENSAQLDK